VEPSVNFCRYTRVSRRRQRRRRWDSAPTEFYPFGEGYRGYRLVAFPSRKIYHLAALAVPHGAVPASRSVDSHPSCTCVHVCASRGRRGGGAWVVVVTSIYAAPAARLFADWIGTSLTASQTMYPGCQRPGAAGNRFAWYIYDGVSIVTLFHAPTLSLSLSLTLSSSLPSPRARSQS